MAFENPTISYETYSGIDATASGALYFFTSDEQNFVPINVNVGSQVVTGFSSAPTISVGTNSPNYDNILAATSLSSFNNSDMNGDLGVNNMVSEVPSGSDVYINVSVAAVSTTYTLRISVGGILYE